MKKHSLFRRATPEEESEITARYRSYDLIYAMNMLQLQETANLTFREAKAFLVEYKETECDLADDWGVSLQAVYNLQRRAREKIRKCGKTLEEIYGEYQPVDRGTILVCSS